MSQDSTFAYESMPVRVRFGDEAVSALPEELLGLDATRVAVFTSARHAALVEAAAAAAPGVAFATFDDVRQHVPADLARAAVAFVDDHGADTVVGIGGGSAVGFAKAVAKERDVMTLAVPTTYSGSEMTPIWGITTETGKETGKDPAVLPDVVVYDPRLLESLPIELVASSGLNAVAHAVEAFYAPQRNPVTDLLACDALRHLSGGLRGLVAAHGDHDAPDADADDGRRALYGACLAGMALGQVGTSLHHKICHVLGGKFGLAHAETHAVVLPHSVAAASELYPSLTEPIAACLADTDVVDAVAGLARDLGAPTSLAALGMAQGDIEDAATASSAALMTAGIDLPPPRVRKLLLDAYQGPP